MRFLFSLFVLLSQTFYSSAQSEKQKECFLLSQYLFCPQEKSIEEISLNGQNSYKLNYDYDSTTLYIFGDKFFINRPTILEFLKDNSGSKVKTVDLEKLHVYSVQSMGYNSDVMLAYDDNGYYSITGLAGSDKGKLSKLEPRNFPANYERLTPYIIRDKEKDKKYIVICKRGYIDIIDMPHNTDIDIATFKFIANEINTTATAFYTDRNGLYVFSKNERFSLGKIADSEGKDILPVVTDTHIIYGKKVFSRGFFSNGNKKETEISLYPDVNNLRVYHDITPHKSVTTIVNDGKTAYVFSFVDSDILSVKEDSVFADIDRLLSKGDILFYKDDERPRNLYIAYDIEKEGIEYQTLLRVKDLYKTIATVGNMYRTTQQGEVYIYNTEKEAYELLDYSQYRYIGNGFFAYKNMLYNSVCTLQSELKDIDASKVYRLADNNVETKLLTDGQILIYATPYIFQKNIVSSFLKPQLTKGNIHIYKNVDMESIRVITPSLLMDKNNLYYAHSYGLEVIPMKELGIPVKVIPVKE